MKPKSFITLILVVNVMLFRPINKEACIMTPHLHIVNNRARVIHEAKFSIAITPVRLRLAGDVELKTTIQFLLIYVAILTLLQ